MAKPASKPLSFSTTLRNPHRIADFLFCLKPFDGKILTSEVIFEIIKEVLKRKIYYTMPELQNDKFREIYESDAVFSDKQLDKIIEISPQKHKEAGFEYGWPSRFDTWYELLKEFGFVSYSMGNVIDISASGLLMANSVLSAPANYKQWEYDENAIQSAMLNSMAKYQIDNPFSKNSNQNNPLVLLLKTIRLLKESGINNGISRSEISFLICWPNHDANALKEYIIEFRNSHGYIVSDEIVYDRCLSLLGVDHTREKRFKISQITGEAVDEYIRKMRLTGIISLRGNGRFIDENQFEKEKIDYILEKYNEYIDFSSMSSQDYFEFMGAIDPKLMYELEVVHPGLNEVRKKTLKEYSVLYDDTKLFKELDIACSKNKASDDLMLKLVDKPTRFEFLISVLLCKRYGIEVVSPNYDVDDEGLPKHTAQNGLADIVCEDINTLMLVEVSLMQGRSDQINNEIVPIQRHLSELENPASKDKNAIFVSPRIHSDTELACRYARLLDKINLFARAVCTFKTDISNADTITQLSSHLKEEFEPII